MSKNVSLIAASTSFSLHFFILFAMSQRVDVESSQGQKYSSAAKVYIYQTKVEPAGQQNPLTPQTRQGHLRKKSNYLVSDIPSRPDVLEGSKESVPSRETDSVSSDEPATDLASDTPIATNTSVESALEMISPCRAISLPERLLNTPHLFPRKYSVEFSLAGDSNIPEFRILKLEPENTELPYADRLIRTAFETCVNLLAPERLVAFHEQVQALKPSSGDAYSVVIEFQSPRARGEANKGI